MKIDDKALANLRRLNSERTKAAIAHSMAALRRRDAQREEVLAEAASAESHERYGAAVREAALRMGLDPDRSISFDLNKGEMSQQEENVIPIQEVK